MCLLHVYAAMQFITGATRWNNTSAPHFHYRGPWRWKVFLEFAHRGAAVPLYEGAPCGQQCGLSVACLARRQNSRLAQVCRREHLEEATTWNISIEGSTFRSIVLREFESSSSDPPQAIERKEVGEERLH